MNHGQTYDIKIYSYISKSPNITKSHRSLHTDQRSAARILRAEQSSWDFTFQEQSLVINPSEKIYDFKLDDECLQTVD